MKKAFLFISTAFLLSSCAAVKSPVTGYVYQETQSPVVDNMRKQNMLKEDKIAELLKDNPNEK